MAQDWAADVKKFVANADDEVIDAIVKYCGIALHNQDSSLVSFTDPAETGRVRENFLKKKLGLTHSDADLDAGIAAVGERMKGTNFKNRVTVYYLLLEQFGMLDFFRKGGAAIAGAAGAGVAAASAAGNRDDEEAKPAVTTPVSTPSTSASVAAPAAVAGAAAAGIGASAASAAPLRATGDDHATAAAPHTTSNEPAYAEEERSGGLGWLWWLLGALVVLGLLWALFFRQPAAKVEEPAAPVATAPVATPAAPVTDLTKAPAEGSVAIPEGAGVTSELRDGKPVVKVYFDTAKTEVAPAFAGAATALKTYLDSHSGSSLAVSGFNDPRGNAAANAELSKNRAQAVKAELVKAGIADGSVELVKPAEATDTTTDNANARRVEVVVR